MVFQLSLQKSRDDVFNPCCVRIASRGRIESEREKIREHEREEKYVKIEENILNRIYSFVRRQKVHLFPHAR